MDSLFGNLKGFFKAPSVTIDNHAFRLHYRATFIILVAFSLMVTSKFFGYIFCCCLTSIRFFLIGKQYFGDPIDCISKDDIPSKLLGMYPFLFAYFSHFWHVFIYGSVYHNLFCLISNGNVIFKVNKIPASLYFCQSPMHSSIFSWIGNSKNGFDKSKVSQYLPV